MPTFAPRTVGANAPLLATYNGFSIAPSDSVDIPRSGNQPCVALHCAGAGNIAVQLFGGGTATLTGLSAGQFVAVGATRVLATGTTATGISALYANTY